MKDLEQQFREQSKQISVTPKSQTWGLIRAKLKSHRSQRKLLSSGIVTITVATLFILAICVAIVMYYQNQAQLKSKSQPDNTELQDSIIPMDDE